MTKYEFTSIRWIEGKQKKVIVDICGDIINRSPTIEDLKGLKRQLSIHEILKLPEEETKKHLLEFLRYFCDKERRFPTTMDFANNPKYPNFSTYEKVFGNLNNAMTEAGFELLTYKILVSKDGINFEWVIIKDGKVIWNPAEEDLKNLNQKSYSRENICHICKEENNITDKSILYPKNVSLNTDKDGNKMEEYVCKIHGKRNYSHNNPSSIDNLKKQLAHSRTGCLTDPRQMLAEKCEKLTEKWTGAKRLSEKFDKYSMLPNDHDPITKHLLLIVGNKLVDLYEKVPQTKGRRYDSERGRWECASEDYIKKFDILIFYCISEDGKTIERIYIIPRKEAINGTMAIIKNPKMILTTTTLYEQYRVADEYITNINSIWQK